MDELTSKVLAHFKHKGRALPTMEDALIFIMTEVAEVGELLLTLPGKDFKRNHPENHPPFSLEAFADELADIVYMVIILGRLKSVDPLSALRRKVTKELEGE